MSDTSDDKRWDEFDRIVEGLELDLSFPDEPEVTPPPPEHQPVDDTLWDDAPTYDDDVSYRVPPPVEHTPWSPRRLMAVLALAGMPIGLALAALFGVFLPRAVVVLAGLIFVGAAIYLIAQLPEHGPGRRDWPDDGAVL